MRSPGRERLHGFTLIELLVVIAIIAVLAAILFPVFAAARERARTSVCQSNLRQIGMAMEEYKSDWDGCFPNTNTLTLWMGRYWRWSLKPYLALGRNQVSGDPTHSTGSDHNVLICPSDTLADKSFDGTSYAYSLSFYVAPSDINTMTTFANTYANPTLTFVTYNESAVTYPSQKAMFTEWTSNHKPPHVGWNDTKSWDGARVYLFADGHCKFLQSRQIHPANDNLPDINLTRDGITGKDID